MAIMAQKRALRNYRTRLVKRGMAFAEDDDFLWSIRRVGKGALRAVPTTSAQTRMVGTLARCPALRNLLGNFSGPPMATFTDIAPDCP
jgi:hypothetical protein